MDCKTARTLAELRSRCADELPGEEALAVDRHLENCPDCFAALQSEERFDAPVRKAMNAVPVPPNLKSRILDRLALERGAWHRRRIYAVVGAAAAIMVAVGLFNWNPNRKARFDVNELVYFHDEYVRDPKPAVDAWLAAQEIQFNPPIALDPRFLAFHGMASIKGKQVPILYYRSFERNVFAQVYIVRERDFDLSNLPQTFSGSSFYGHQVQVFRDDANRQAYVILFNGDSLEPLLVKFSST